VRREPKTTAGVRSITISRTTARKLADHLETYGVDDPDSLVFTTATGTPISHSSFQTHHYKPALAAAGVDARFHDLRHTSVALAIAAGAHPKAIQVRMGHSSITVTLDRYGHLFPELDEAIADAFDDRWEAVHSAAD
jgi:integrase